MATNNNTIKTRIQLKSDTEQKWRESVLTTDHPQGLKTSGTSFVPLKGELIIFEPDNTHQYSRLKVGTGNLSDNVLALPFIDSGTINGEETEIEKYNGTINFPAQGNVHKLYIDTATNKIYHYDPINGYSQLAHFTFTPMSINCIENWSAGSMTTVTVSNSILTITNGNRPTLTLASRQVITDITEE